MIPLKDENPTTRRPVLTLLLIAINVLVYFAVQPHNDAVEDAEFTYKHAAIPCEVVTGEPVDFVQVGSGQVTPVGCDEPEGRPLFPDKSVFLAVLYSMFLHGGLLHLGGNMLFLWIFGNNIEDRMGYAGYLVFYLLSGLAAAAAHILADPSSDIPVIGASGAVAGVMGAYLVLFPNAPIKTIFIFFIILFREIRAKWLLAFWFVSQFFISPNSGVAWLAHVGGFVFGAAVALALRSRLRPPERLAWRY